MKLRASCCGVLFILLLALSTASSAQVLGGIRGPIPEGLKPSIDTRLAQFIQAQATDDWEQVATLLGPYHRFGQLPNTEQYKKCLISQMREARMTSFVPGERSFSVKEPMSVLADTSSWSLSGDATFQTSKGEKKQSFSLRVYRYEDEWYFEPNEDQDWEKIRLTKAELEADHSDEILVRNEPTAPLQISDVHTSINREYPSLLNVRFTLKNVSGRTIKWFSVSLYIKDPGASFSTPREIEPGGSVEITELDRVRYLANSCEPYPNDNLIVDSAMFAEGDEWKNTKP